jgi:flagellar hook-basal body complex protein FliE
VSAFPLAVSAVAPSMPTGYLAGPSAAEVPGTGGASFANALVGAVGDVQQLQGTSNQLAVQAVTGDLTDMHAATLASTRASVALELVATVRNRGVEAFNEIMRMQA